jgi:adenylate cyclase
MAQEIERKFLVDLTRWHPGGESAFIAQGYLSTDKDRTVRVRVLNQQAFLTIKGRTVGASRTEFEYEIPADDARIMLRDLCLQPIIEKTRHYENHAGRRWEIDVFHGANEGLVVAEIELDNEADDFARPDWAGEEVTDDPRYFNSNLLAKPYSEWHG